MDSYQKVFHQLEQTHQPTMLEQLRGYSRFQLLISTLLSSRTKDTTTIPIVKKLFKKYPKPEDFVNADIKELEKSLYGIGFYKVKAENIKRSSRIIIEKYNNEVPDGFEEMTKLPGVGRKTANCMLNYAFGKEAVAVDIHVHRIVNRLGWIKTKSPEVTEEELKRTLPKELWKKVNMLFVDHGQRVCFPRNPNCKACKIREYCKFGTMKIYRKELS